MLIGIDRQFHVICAFRDLENSIERNGTFFRINLVLILFVCLYKRIKICPDAACELATVDVHSFNRSRLLAARNSEHSGTDAECH